MRGIKGEPVGIGRLERFVADWHREHIDGDAEAPGANGHKVAVIGSGPVGPDLCGRSGAAWAIRSRCLKRCMWRAACSVYGIPEFRLPKAIVHKEVDNLKALGVDIETDMVIGKVLTIDELFERSAMKRCSSAPARVCRALWASRARA